MGDEDKDRFVDFYQRTNILGESYIPMQGLRHTEIPTFMRAPFVTDLEQVDIGIIGIPYNPANVAFIKNQEGFLSTTNHVADIKYHVLGYGRNLSGIDFVALHIFYLEDCHKMDIYYS